MTRVSREVRRRLTTPPPRWTVADVRRALWHLRTGGVDQVRTWSTRRRLRHRPAVAGVVGRHGLTFEPWVMPDRPPARPDLRVAVVLDDFSRLALHWEWQQVEVTPGTWRETLEAEPVDLLFVESAWAGNGGAWRYHLTGPTAPRAELVDLVAWCRDHGVPTVFWNKEDPAHFEDFLDAARLFDRVLTTDVERLPAYREVLGHDRVGVMPFAAQPVIHNPVRPDGAARRDIAFAGMWFSHRHPERREQARMLLGAARAAGERTEHGLEIFSRELGGDPRYQFPPPFDEHVVGSLDYPRMLAAYRAYKAFLNVNTVVGSPSMCARRVFEITACGTPVVSTPSAAVDALFDRSEVAQVATGQEAEQTLRALVRSPELRDRMVHRAQRRIWSAHTYAHRVDDVLRVTGLERHRVTGRPPSVSALVSTNRPHQVEHVVRTLGAQLDVDLEVVLLLHGVDVDRARLQAVARDAGVDRLVVLEASSDVPLGDCLNRLVDASAGDLLAKVDDDDLYGPRYLADQAAATGWSGAEVVGKRAHYVHVESLRATGLRFAEHEHRYTDFVMGPTIVVRADVARAVRFPAVPTGEDTGFLRAATAAGVTVYSTDRFGFVQVRRAEGGHTWAASDAELLASADVTVFGDPAQHVMV